MERILVTHAGGLIRPAGLLSFLPAMDHGLPCDGLPCDGLPCDGLPCDGLPCDGLPRDQSAYQAALRAAVTGVVRRRTETGIGSSPARSPTTPTR